LAELTEFYLAAPVHYPALFWNSTSGKLHDIGGAAAVFDQLVLFRAQLGFHSAVYVQQEDEREDKYLD